MALVHGIKPIVTSGLVLCLDAANRKSYPGSGTAWTDLSGNGNNGTLSATSIGYNSANGGSLVFDGVNDYVNNSTNFLPNQLFADSNGSWSVSCWFKFPVNPIGTRSVNASWSLIGRSGGIATSGTFIIYVGSETDTTYGAYTPFKVASTIRGAVTVISDSVNTDTWNNVVLTWDGSAGKYYFNTQQGVLSVGAAALQSYTQFYVGGGGSLTGHYYEGSISLVSIYNRALTPQEIQQNFNATRGRYGI